MAAREIVIKTVTDKKVAEKIDKALSKTPEKVEAIKKAKEDLVKKGFILK